MRLYNDDKTINTDNLYEIIMFLLTNYEIRTDYELSNQLKQFLNEQGLVIYKIYCSGNRRKYQIKIAAKEAIFIKNQANQIVTKLMNNRLSMSI